MNPSVVIPVYNEKDTILKLYLRICETGISYSGRNCREGKKTGWKDGISALLCILKYNLLR